MSESYSSEVAEIARMDTERSEMKTTAQRLLRDAFSQFLTPEELDLRLEDVKKARFVSEVEFEKLCLEHPDWVDADGLLTFEIDGQAIHRQILIRQTTHANDLHTLLHESTHLMAPKSHRVFGTVDLEGRIDHEDSEVFTSYVGPIRTNRFVKTGDFDEFSSGTFNLESRTLFWEAVTDWHADEVLKDELTDAEKKVVEGTGYVERFLIEYLVDHVPDREACVAALRKAYADGNEDVFRWYLHTLEGNATDDFYENLLKQMKIKKEDIENRVNRFLELVDEIVKNKKT